MDSSTRINEDKVQIQLNKKDIEWLKEASQNMASWLKAIALLLLAQLIGGFSALLLLFLDQLN